MGVKSNGSLSGNFEGALQEFIAAETITAGDLVVLQSGELACSAATEEICGVAMNSAIATEKVLVNVDPLQKFVMPATGLTAAMVGEHMDLAGTTGAQAAAGADHKTTTAQLTLVKFNTATEGVFMICEYQLQGIN